MNGIAWQLMPAHCDGVWGRGLVIDRKAAQLGEVAVQIGSESIVALASYFETGPLDVGIDGDKHKIGTTEDGQSINSLHISTTALYKKPADPVYDAPLEFLGDYIIPTPGPIYVPVELRYDGRPDHGHVCKPQKGMWRWEARSFIYSPPTEGPPGIPKDPRNPPNDSPGMPVPREQTTDDSGGTYFPLPEDFDIEHGPMAVVGPYVPGNPHEAFAASPMQVAVPALLFRPQDLTPNSVDLRVSTNGNPLAMFRQDTYSPMVMRAEAFAAAQARGYDYTEEPCKQRFRGGTSDGGIAFLAPELSIDDYATDYAPTKRTLSTSYVAVGPSVYFAAGLPDVVRGDVDTGYRWGVSSGKLSFDRLDSSGTVSAGRLTLDASGNVGVATESPSNVFHVATADVRMDLTTDSTFGGAAATLRNVGAPGPVNAGQAGWAQINVGGVIAWFPYWT